MPISSLCGNFVYMLLVFAITSIYFVISGLQFWSTAYMITVISIPATEVFTFYTVMCFTAPTLGLVLSIILFNCIGGYSSRGSLGLCLMIGLLCMLFAVPLPHVK